MLVPLLNIVLHSFSLEAKSSEASLKRESSLTKSFNSAWENTGAINSGRRAEERSGYSVNFLRGSNNDSEAKVTPWELRFQRTTSVFCPMMKLIYIVIAKDVRSPVVIMITNLTTKLACFTEIICLWFWITKFSASVIKICGEFLQPVPFWHCCELRTGNQYMTLRCVSLCMWNFILLGYAEVGHWKSLTHTHFLSHTYTRTHTSLYVSIFSYVYCLCPSKAHYLPRSGPQSCRRCTCPTS